jgi:hypothetical protein
VVDHSTAVDAGDPAHLRLPGHRSDDGGVLDHARLIAVAHDPAALGADNFFMKMGMCVGSLLPTVERLLKPTQAG